MGLESVELVMAVEKSFGIHIDDRDAAQIRTMGQLHEAIALRVQEGRGETCLSARAFRQLRQALNTMPESTAARIAPRTPLEAVLPRARRRQAWRHLAKVMALQMPKLRRTARVRRLSTAAVLAGVALLTWALWRDSGWPPGSYLLVGALVALTVLGALAAALTRPMAVEGFPTVGDLARGVLHENFSTFAIEAGGARDTEIWDTLVEIVVKQIGVRREELSRETRFVEDLGF